jgi:hypothetical protein
MIWGNSLILKNFQLNQKTSEVFPPNNFIKSQISLALQLTVMFCTHKTIQVPNLNMRSMTDPIVAQTWINSLSVTVKFEKWLTPNCYTIVCTRHIASILSDISVGTQLWLETQQQLCSIFTTLSQVRKTIGHTRIVILSPTSSAVLKWSWSPRVCMDFSNPTGSTDIGSTSDRHVDPYFCPEACIFLRIWVTFL